MSHQDDISQIKKYLNGELDARAMHELERRALDDPFLMDALEGYEHKGDQQANLDELSGRLQTRTDKKMIRMIPWGPLSIVASVLILLVAGILFLTRKNVQPARQEIALVEKPVAPAQKAAPAPSASAARAVSDSVVTDAMASNKTIASTKPKDHTVAKTTLADKAVTESNAPPAAELSSPKLAEVSVRKDDTVNAASEYSKVVSAKKKDTLNNTIAYKRSAVNKDQVLQSRVNGVTITTPTGRDKAREEAAKRELGVNDNNDDIFKQNANLAKARRVDTGDVNEKVIGSYASKVSKNAQPSAGYSAQGNQPLIQNSDGSGRTISGHIKSKDDGQPIVGATVKVVGKPFGAVSDVNGKYILKNVPDNASLIVSYIGYNAVKTKVTPADTLDIALYPNQAALSEVVVTSNEPTSIQSAQPTQGWVVFKKYVDDKAISPDGKTGKVHLSFTVGANGDISDIQVTKSLSKDADQKAIDILKANGNWYPATDRKPQKVKLTIKFHE